MSIWMKVVTILTIFAGGVWVVGETSPDFLFWYFTDSFGVYETTHTDVASGSCTGYAFLIVVRTLGVYEGKGK